MAKTVVIISDLQVPYHDKRAVASLQKFIADFKPDSLVCVGDDLDSPETSHWEKGRAGEYAGTLQRSIDDCHEVHRGFRESLGDNRPYHISRSNHGDRTNRYIARYAPALRDLRGLRLSELLGYDKLQMEFHPAPFAIAPGWVCAHGDEGTLSSIPGRTAALLAAKWSVNVACGHSHRAGVSGHTYGYNGKIVRSVTGLEVGHLMNLKDAAYVQGPNWQKAFGILYVSDRREVTPVLVPVFNGGRFQVEGQCYGEA